MATENRLTTGMALVLCVVLSLLLILLAVGAYEFGRIVLAGRLP